MSYSSGYLGDTTITISTKDMVAIADAALGIAPPVTDINGIPLPAAQGSTNWLMWGGVALAAFFILRK